MSDLFAPDFEWPRVTAARICQLATVEERRKALESVNPVLLPLVKAHVGDYFERKKWPKKQS